MRVLHVGLSASYGGIESFALNYAREMTRYGIIFDFADMYGDGIACEEQIRQMGGKIYTMPNFKRHPLRAMGELEALIRTEGYTNVHINMLSAASLISVGAALRANVKPIVHSHNASTQGLIRKVLHPVNARILKRLPVKRLACGRDAGRFMFGEDPFAIVPNAVDLERFAFSREQRDSIRHQYGISGDCLVLGFVGRLEMQKNPLFLADILAALGERRPGKSKLLIIGTGSMKQALIQRAREQGVAEDIIFAGVQQDVGPWYSAMDAFVLPSLFEGLPIVGVEAQAAGLPCFLSDNITDEICMTDLVQKYTLSGDADHWAKAILDAADADRDRGGYAAIMADTVYSIDKAVSVLKEYYR